MANNSAKHYNFVSRWKLNAPPGQVWAAIVNPVDWPKWWPALERVQPMAQTETLEGSQMNAAFRAPLGYRLHLGITVTGVQDLRSIKFDSTGDLQGGGRMELSNESGMTNLTIYWNVATTKPWMNQYSSLLGPIFRVSHARVMRSGELGLRRWLA